MGQRVGKRGYMAPEVYNKMVYDSRKADVWSLGVMLFMMLVGAPPYKRATKRDAAFNYIINGMLSDVLKHWKRLRLISADALDCMEKMLKWEKARITMEQLVCHPFVGLDHLLKRDNADYEHSYVRIKTAIKAYHDQYAVLMQAQFDKKKDQSSKSGNNAADNEQLLISFQTKVSRSDKFILPQFESACKPILENGNVRLLEDFNFILAEHAASNQMIAEQIVKSQANKPEIAENEEDKSSVLSLLQIGEEMTDNIKNNAFLNVTNSIIIRRCFRNRAVCKDESGLLKVYGEYNKNVIGDDEHRMAMQIMDKIYCYFAYSNAFGYVFTDDEIRELTESADDKDVILAKTKEILKRKAQNLLKTNHHKKIYQVMENRKVKFCTSSKNYYSEKKKEEHKESTIKELKSLNPFANIKQTIQNHLAQIKTPQTMDHSEFMKFIKTLQVRCKKEEKFASLKAVTSDQWKALISKFNSIQYSESDFTELGRKRFGVMFKKSISAGSVIKLFKAMTDTLDKIHQKQFSTKKEELSQLDCSELIGLILSALKNNNIDVENVLNLEKMQELFVKDNIDGAALINLDDAYIVNNYIKPWEADFKYFL